jgi:hypothetical protein
MAPNGGLTILRRSGPYQPGPPAGEKNMDRSGGGGMADAVSGMIQKQKVTARRGAARAGDVLTSAAMDPPDCAMRPPGQLADLPRELAAGCEKRAETILAQTLAAQIPATVTLYTSYTASDGGMLKAEAIANFDSYLVCRIERASGAPGAPVGPAMLASSTEGKAGAFAGVGAGDVLACIAFEAEADARAAQRAWPSATPRSDQGRRVASAWASAR